jgi:hypothetical protein
MVVVMTMVLLMVMVMHGAGPCLCKYVHCYSNRGCGQIRGLAVEKRLLSGRNRT